MTATWGLRINGTDTRDLGFYLEAKPGFDGRGGTPVTAADLPARDGTLLLARRFGARSVQYAGALITPENTAAARIAAQRALTRLLRSGPLTLESFNGLTEPLIVEGVVTEDRVTLRGGGPELAAGARVEFTVQATAGTFRVRDPDTLVLGPTPRSPLLGDAPSHWEAWISGPATAAALVFTEASGVETARIELGSLAGNETLVLRSAEETVILRTDGVESNGLARIGDSPFPPFGLTPYDGADQGVALLGGPIGTLTWTRRFW